MSHHQGASNGAPQTCLKSNPNNSSNNNYNRSEQVFFEQELEGQKEDEEIARGQSNKSMHNDDSMSLDWTLNMRRKCRKFFSSSRLVKQQKENFYEQENDKLYANLPAQVKINQDDNASQAAGHSLSGRAGGHQDLAARQVIRIDDIHIGRESREQLQQQPKQRQQLLPNLPAQNERRAENVSSSPIDSNEQEAIKRRNRDIIKLENDFHFEDELIFDDRLSNKSLRAANGCSLLPTASTTAAHLNNLAINLGQRANSPRFKFELSISTRDHGATTADAATAAEPTTCGCQSDNLSALSASSSLLSQLLNSSLNQLIEIDNGSSASPSCELQHPERQKQRQTRKKQNGLSLKSHHLAQVDERDLLVKRRPPSKEASAAACLLWMRQTSECRPQKQISGHVPWANSRGRHPPANCSGGVSNQLQNGQHPAVACAAATSRTKDNSTASIESSRSSLVGAVALQAQGSSISGCSSRSHSNCNANSTESSSGPHAIDGGQRNRKSDRQMEGARRLTRCRPRLQQQQQQVDQQKPVASNATLKAKEQHSNGQQFVTFDESNNELRESGGRISISHMSKEENNISHQQWQQQQQQPHPELEARSSQQPQVDHTAAAVAARATLLEQTATPKSDCCSKCPPEPLIDGTNSDSTDSDANSVAIGGATTMSNGSSGYHQQRHHHHQIQQHDSLLEVSQCNKQQQQQQPAPLNGDLFAQECRNFQCCPFCLPMEAIQSLARNHDGQPASGKLDMANGVGGATLIGAPFVTRTSSSGNRTSQVNSSNLSGNLRRNSNSISNSSSSNIGDKNRKTNAQLSISSLESSSNSNSNSSSASASNSASSSASSTASSSCGVRVTATDSSEDSSDQRGLLKSQAQLLAAKSDSAGLVEQSHMGSPASLLRDQEEQSGQAPEVKQPQEAKRGEPLAGAVRLAPSSRDELDWLVNGAYADIKSQLERSAQIGGYLSTNNSTHNNDTNVIKNFTANNNTSNNFLALPLTRIGAQANASTNQEQQQPADLRPIFGLDPRSLNSDSQSGLAELDADRVSMVEARAKLARVVAASGSNSSVSSSASSLVKLQFQAPSLAYRRRPLASQVLLRLAAAEGEPIYDVPSLSIENSPNGGPIRCLSPDQKYPLAREMAQASQRISGKKATEETAATSGIAGERTISSMQQFARRPRGPEKGKATAVADDEGIMLDPERAYKCRLSAPGQFERVNGDQSRYDKCKCAQCSQLRALKLYLSAARAMTTTTTTGGPHEKDQSVNGGAGGGRRLIGPSRLKLIRAGPHQASSGLSMISRLAVDGSEQWLSRLKRRKSRLRRTKGGQHHPGSCYSASCCSSCCSKAASTLIAPSRHRHRHRPHLHPRGRPRGKRRLGGRRRRRRRRRVLRAGSSITATSATTSANCCCSYSDSGNSEDASCCPSCCASSSSCSLNSSTATTRGQSGTSSETGSLTQEYLRRHRGGRRLRRRLRRLYRAQRHHLRSRAGTRKQAARRLRQTTMVPVLEGSDITIGHKVGGQQTYDAAAAGAERLHGHDDNAAHSHGRHARAEPGKARRRTPVASGNGFASLARPRQGRSRRRSGGYQVAGAEAADRVSQKRARRLINGGHAREAGRVELAQFANGDGDSDRVPLVSLERTASGRRLGSGSGGRSFSSNNSESSLALRVGRRNCSLLELARTSHSASHDLRLAEADSASGLTSTAAYSRFNEEDEPAEGGTSIANNNNNGNTDEDEPVAGNADAQVEKTGSEFGGKFRDESQQPKQRQPLSASYPDCELIGGGLKGQPKGRGESSSSSSSSSSRSSGSSRSGSSAETDDLDLEFSKAAGRSIGGYDDANDDVCRAATKSQQAPASGNKLPADGDDHDDDDDVHWAQPADHRLQWDDGRARVARAMDRVGRRQQRDQSNEVVHCGSSGLDRLLLRRRSHRNPTTCSSLDSGNRVGPGAESNYRHHAGRDQRRSSRSHHRNHHECKKQILPTRSQLRPALGRSIRSHSHRSGRNGRRHHHHYRPEHYHHRHQHHQSSSRCQRQLNRGRHDRLHSESRRNSSHRRAGHSRQHPCHCGSPTTATATATTTTRAKGFSSAGLNGGDYLTVDAGQNLVSFVGSKERQILEKEKVLKLKQSHHLATGLLLRRAAEQSGQRQLKTTATGLKQLGSSKRRHFMEGNFVADKCGNYLFAAGQQRQQQHDPNGVGQLSSELNELGQSHYVDRMLGMLSSQQGRRRRDLGLIEGRKASRGMNVMATRSPLKSGLTLPLVRPGGSRRSSSLRTSLCSGNLLTTRLGRRSGHSLATLNKLRSMQRARDANSDGPQQGRRLLLLQMDANGGQLASRDGSSSKPLRSFKPAQSQLMDKFLLKAAQNNSRGQLQQAQSGLSQQNHPFGWPMARRCQCSHCCLVEKFILMDAEAKRRRKLKRKQQKT